MWAAGNDSEDLKASKGTGNKFFEEGRPSLEDLLELGSTEGRADNFGEAGAERTIGDGGIEIPGIEVSELFFR